MYELILQIPFNGFHIKGILSLPVKARSIIIFSPGFGNPNLNPHEQKMARKFQKEGFGTLVFDLLDEKKELPGSYKNIDLLSEGLRSATTWLHRHSEYKDLDLAYIGSGSGAAIALKSSIQLGSVIKTVVSLSGRLDLIEKELSHVPCPTLLIAGELDFKGVNISSHAIKHLKSQKQLAVIPAASHLYEEPGKLAEAANITITWFRRYLLAELKSAVWH